MNQQVWIHNLSPYIFHLNETTGVRWYGSSYLAGFFIGAALMIFMSRRGASPLPEKSVADFMTYVVFGTLLGGRLGYVLFYKPELFVTFNSSFSLNFPFVGEVFSTHHFWNAFSVWEGGMSSHGGIIGVMFAAYLYSRRHAISWFHLTDLITLGGTAGIFLGRIANFINGELQGRECSAALPWAVKFPTDIYRWFNFEPERLASLGPTASQVGVTVDQWNTWVGQYRANLENSGPISAVLDRVIASVQAGNQQVLQSLAEILPPRHPSQLYEAFLEGAFLFVLLMWTWRKAQKPGVITALFLTAYSIVRIIGEQFRLPDGHLVHQEFASFGVTRGQVLSFLQLIVSTAYLYWALKRSTEKLPGWTETPKTKASRKKQRG